MAYTTLASRDRTPPKSRARAETPPAAVSESGQSAAPARVSYVTAEEGDSGQRIDNFLQRILKDAPRSLVYRILRSGEVRVNSARVGPEYRLVVDHSGPLADLRIEVEPAGGDGRDLAEAVGRAVRDELLFRVEVLAVPPNTLPRFEMKARRLVRMQSSK